jgi:hypothetical protein
MVMLYVVNTVTTLEYSNEWEKITERANLIYDEQAMSHAMSDILFHPLVHY